METDRDAILRSAYNVDTGVEWRQVGNTLYYGKGADDFFVILGGEGFIRHLVNCQPRKLLPLLARKEGLE